MRENRFREALAGYVHGLAIAHLRLLSAWSVTAARWHAALTGERGPAPEPRESYRESETPLRTYAASLAYENDLLRCATRLGVWAMAERIAMEVCERVASAAATALQLVRGLAIAVGIVALSLAGALAIAGGLHAALHGLEALARRPVVPDRPDAGVPRPIRIVPMEVCVEEVQEYVLEWRSWEASPRLVGPVELHPYWTVRVADRPLRQVTERCLMLRDCGDEIFPRPAQELVITLD